LNAVLICSNRVQTSYFQAYASGCNLVILSFDFQRVQIIPGDVQISCVHCSTESGKVAAAYQNKIKIFEPTLSKEPDHPNPVSVNNYNEPSMSKRGVQFI